MFHGTDPITAAVAVRRGFSLEPPDHAIRTRYAEPGWLHGTPELEWARAYARARARQYRFAVGTVVRVDLTDIDVEDDPTVALDGLPAPAYRARTPIAASRVSIEEEVHV
jgi:hypothetical protein